MRAAKAARPGLPVVLMTGYADTALVDAEVDRRFVLQKPYKMQELAARAALALADAELTRRVT
jgi:DNA-binding NtrC family response regulator